jgi:hypothetical protein
MTDTENTSTAHEEPKSKTPSFPTVSESLLFKSGWQEFGFVLAVMLGQSFNLTPFGGVNALASSLINYLKLILFFS